MTTEAGNSRPKEDEAESVEAVRDFLTSLAKAVRTRRTYVAGNPLIDRFLGETSDRIATLWDQTDRAALVVDESRFVWNSHEVYAQEVRQDNMAFLFFRSGIREIVFLPGFENEELAAFVEIIGGGGLGEPDDLLAQLWHRDFQNFRMAYVDVVDAEGLDVPQPDRSAGAGGVVEDREEFEEVLAGGTAEAAEGEAAHEEAAQEDFSELALGEPDVTYLRREMEAEWTRPLARDVTLALLDQFEMRDMERREQVVDILREMMPRLLSARDFDNVAMVVTELQLLANKTGDEATQALVNSLLRDMSEAMAEMISAVDEGGAAPAREQIDALSSALQAEAIPTLVRAIPSVRNRRTRQQLSEALDRLVAAHPEYVIDMLEAEDPVLAAEAAHIVARLKIDTAEAALIGLLDRPEDLTRRAAIEALTLIGSAAGLKALLASLEDESRDIRLSAIETITDLRPEGAIAALARCVAASPMRARDHSEQMACLKAYAAVGQEAAIPQLNKMLNKRSWWLKKEIPSLRAAAASALGLIRLPAARTALDKASGDRDSTVGSAVRVALREHTASERDEVSSVSDVSTGPSDPGPDEPDPGPDELDLGPEEPDLEPEEPDLEPEEPA